MPEKGRGVANRLTASRQRMGLRVGDHLQPVLGPAKRQIQAAERRSLFLFDPSFPGEGLQRRKGAPEPQRL